MLPEDSGSTAPGGDPVVPDATPEPAIGGEKPQRQKRTYSKRKSIADVEAPVLIKKTDELGNPVETQEEHTARLSRESNESWHKTFKDWLIHGVFAFLLVVVTLTCLFIIARSESEKQPEAIKLASTLLTAIITGGASFFAGKAAGNARPS